MDITGKLLMFYTLLSHILLQYVNLCMSNNNEQSVLVILPRANLPSYNRICPRIQLPVSAQWSQRLYVKVQVKMMHKDMHKIVFQSN